MKKEPCDFHRERGQIEFCLLGPKNKKEHKEKYDKNFENLFQAIELTANECHVHFLVIMMKLLRRRGYKNVNITYTEYRKRS